MKGGQQSSVTEVPVRSTSYVDIGSSANNLNIGDTATDYRMAIGHREIATVKSSTWFPRPLIMLYGPGTYQPTAQKKLSALQSYLSIAEYMLSQEAFLVTSHLWHDDLHAENIFVDPNRLTEVLEIIDWQSVQLVPLLDHRLDPPFLDYGGPKVEGLERPQPPANLNDLDDEERAVAVSHYMATSLVTAFKTWIHAKNQRLYRAMEFQNSESANVLWLSRRIFEFGEANFLTLVAYLKDIWADFPGVRARGNPPFPLQFSEAQLNEIQADVEGVVRARELMGALREKLGHLWPDEGVVPHNQYEAVKKALHELKEEIVSQLANTEHERTAWQEAWPFDD